MKTTMNLSIFLPMAAVLTLGVAAVYAQEPVKMTFSGTAGASASNLQQPIQGMAKTITLGQARWVHSPFDFWKRTQILRQRPTLAPAQM